MEFCLAVALLLSTVLITDGQIMRPDGKCPDIPAQKPFDIEKHAGRWFLTEGTVFQPSSKSKCSNAFYTYINSTTASLVTYQLLLNGTNTEEDIGTGILKIIDPLEPGKLLAIPDSGGNIFPHWILKTDYQTYKLLYSCTDVPASGDSPAQAFELVFLLSRKRYFVNSKRREFLLKYLSDNGITTDLVPHDQTECPPVPGDKPVGYYRGY